MTNTLDLDALATAVEAMSPSPWQELFVNCGSHIEAHPNGFRREIGYSDHERNENDENDAAGIVALRNAAPTLFALARRAGELEAAMRKVSAIRDSIVGAQSINWSEHIYPLVAVLDGAGFKGAGYEIARANLGTLLDRNAALEAALREALSLAESLAEDAREYGDPPVDVFARLRSLLSPPEPATSKETP